ncbi:MAG: DHA2 family efflux MFS transporter permease subunit [Pseudomonadota bacterium]
MDDTNADANPGAQSPRGNRNTKSNPSRSRNGGLSAIAVWAGFLAMCVGMFMAILDIQIVVTSLPAIQQALDIAPEQMSWVQTSYLIAEVIAIALTGLLTRTLSIRWLFLGALLVFTAASFACAMADGFWPLIAARAVQGLAGGCLIPLVFSSVFLLIDEKHQSIATTIAGGLAVLAPTLGPTVGGYITQQYDWPWLFLVNIAPGLLALMIGFIVLPRQSLDFKQLLRIDILTVLAICTALVALEIGLKNAPTQGWLSSAVLPVLILSLISAAFFVRRSLKSPQPILDLKLLKSPNMAVACGISFVFGIGLFSSIYLMCVFLGLVGLMEPLEIGLIVIVTGIAQLLVAPVVVQLELRLDARLLTAAGLIIFGTGLLMSTTQTRQTGFDEMFWPQIVRGIGIMLCLIPPTRLALNHLAEAQVPDGSALFNLMRNLGGAIGIAVVDTILWVQTPIYAEAFGQRLAARDMEAVSIVGIPAGMLPPPGTAPTVQEIALARPLVERAGMTEAFNDAWLAVGVLTLLAVVLLPFARSTRPA